MTQQEKKIISDVVGEYFLRIMKNHKFYPLFRRLVVKNYGGNNAFIKGQHYSLIIANHADRAEKEFTAHARTKDNYEYITFFINSLLRNYLEQGLGIQPQRLGMIGQEMFDTICYVLYGDQYMTDMANLEAQTGIRAPKNEKEAMILAEYEARMRQGEQLDFNEFYAKRMRMTDDEFWNFNHREMPDEMYEEVDDNEDVDEEDWDDEETDGGFIDNAWGY